MLFQSVEFLLYFLPFTLLGYFLVQRYINFNTAKIFLIGCSLFFYSWLKPSYLPIFIGAAFFNYYLGKYFRTYPNSEWRFKLFIFGLASNLGLLFVFKYADFAFSFLNFLTGISFPSLKWMLPLGISFFTFQNIAYLVDNYEGLGEERKASDYLLYLAFFPHLLAGPIMHHKELLDQFKEARPFDPKNIYLGLYVFSIGLAKKIIIADTFAKWANAGFTEHLTLNFVEGWATAFAFLVQLYFDFSGYSDMAIGLGLLFNIKLPINFNSPLKATSLIDFWQRWHITLTRFINNYVYTPLVRSFTEPTLGSLLCSTFIAMFLAGIWHGAGWTFVAFGTWHGMGLVLNHLMRRQQVLRLPKILCWPLTFSFVLLGFVLFRAENMTVALNVYKGMLGFNGIKLDPALLGPIARLMPSFVELTPSWFAHVGTLDRKFIAFSFIVLLILGLAKNTRDLAQSFQWSWRNAFATATLAILTINIIYTAAHPEKFLYFNF